MQNYVKFPIIRLICGALILAFLAIAHIGYTPISITNATTHLQYETILNSSKLGLSNETKYLTTYDNPHKWIDDEKKARAERILFNTEREKSSILGTIPYVFGNLLDTYFSVPNQIGIFADKVITNYSMLRDAKAPETTISEKLYLQHLKTRQQIIEEEVGYPKIIQFFDALGKLGFYFTNNGEPYSFIFYFFFALIVGLVPMTIAYRRNLSNANKVYWLIFASMCAPFGLVWFIVALFFAIFGKTQKIVNKSKK